MGRYGGDDYIVSGNWNVAEVFSKFKIMKPLADIDEYIRVCNFGATELVNELSLDEETQNRARVTALKRLHKTIEMLIRNTLFAIRTKDKENMREQLEYIIQLEKFIPKVQRTVKVARNGTFINQTKLDEKIFNSMLDILVNISQEILTPLNKADLIFTSVDEYDPVAQKAEILRELAEEG